MLGALIALLWVQAFQSLTTNPSDSGNQSLGSPILTKSGWVFNRDIHSLEAIARFLRFKEADGTKRIFVTSTTHNGNLWWVSWADTICQNTANSQSLGWNWNAFLSDSTSNFITRYTTDNTKYIYVNLLWYPIFTGWLPWLFQSSWDRRSAADFLTYNNLTTESSTRVENATYWTSTGVNGMNINTHHCTNWTASASVNWYRWYNSPQSFIDAVWNPTSLQAFYYYSTAVCSGTYRLLCIER